MGKKLTTIWSRQLPRAASTRASWRWIDATHPDDCPNHMSVPSGFGLYPISPIINSARRLQIDNPRLVLGYGLAAESAKRENGGMPECTTFTRTTVWGRSNTDK
ncbi:hypothetical protein GB937_005307 [Aspergillus fischeri]|nr:hypothetical protein GB937_005307 [Aspergillus fischeri]